MELINIDLLPVWMLNKEELRLFETAVQTGDAVAMSDGETTYVAVVKNKMVRNKRKNLREETGLD